MRNLKKILALVLALVMSMSVMAVASADFTDADKVNPAYAEAVNTLAALEVFQGYKDGSFQPKGDITRAEVAAIIYRIDTKDIYNKQFGIYADYNKFDDVKSTSWYAGYVNYCANAEYVKGYDEATFGPNDKVTGYQVLAMILRVVGYDQNDEFTGSAWQIEVAKVAQQLGITKNVTEDTLGAPATRELVAELLYRAILVPQVKYTLAFGYSKYEDIHMTKENPSIEEAKIGLGYETLDDDEWGRPGATQWVAKKWTKQVLATYAVKPDYVYYTSVNECDLAKTLGYGTKNDIVVYTNGVKSTDTIDPLHTSHTNPAHQVGEQGTLMEIYVNADLNAQGKAVVERIVMVDTYLAKTTTAVKQVLDKNNHVKVAAKNDVEIYFDTLANGDMVVLNDKTTEIPGVDGVAQYAKDTYLLVNYNEEYGFMVVEGIPEEINAAQYKLHWNEEKHTLSTDGGKTSTTYNDNVNYVLDTAKRIKDETFRWFFDAQGNVIGSAEPKPVPATPDDYVIVTAVQWVNGLWQQGKAMAKVLYLDGTTAEVEIESVNGNTTKYVGTVDNFDFLKGQVCTTLQNNKNSDIHTRLYTYVVDEKTGALELTVVDNEYIAEQKKITAGISDIFGDDTYYVDNDTIFYFYNNGTLEVVEGYTAAALKGANGLGIYATHNTLVFSVDENDELDQFVDIYYIAAHKDVEKTAPAGKEQTIEKFVYLTDDGFALKLKDGNYALEGFVDYKMDDSDLIILANTYGTADNTEAVLDELVYLYQDTLFVYTAKYDAAGKLYETTLKPVLMGSAVAGGLTAQYLQPAENKTDAELAAGKYYFIGTGVLKFNKVALNVTLNTIIFNNEGVAEKIDDVAYNYEGNLYAIYDAKEQAVTIILTPAPIDGNLYQFSEKTLYNIEKNADLTYTVGTDVEADFEAALVADYETGLARSIAAINAIEKRDENTAVTVEATLNVEKELALVTIEGQEIVLGVKVDKPETEA